MNTHNPAAIEPRIAIIGAGMAGIATAVTLQRHGFTDFTIYEKGADVGGVWHWNTYPGLSCDVPSQLYQFGFAPKPDWTHVFARGDEIQRYYRDVVDQFGLEQRVRLNSEITSAVFDGQAWQLSVADGSLVEVDFVICATGVLHHPFTPEIAGLETFNGEVVHTARWDAALVTNGKRIAVIGSGSTAVQIVSALQPNAEELIQFVRSPQWVVSAPTHLRQPRAVSAVLRRFPRLNRALFTLLLRATGILTDFMIRPSWRRTAFQQLARRNLRRQVQDPGLRAALTPDYQPYCKRQVISGTYYGAIQSANARLVNDEIEAITPTGIRTTDGREHLVDIIILATGFHAHNYMRPMNLRGRDGLSIDEAWAKGPRAYRMTAIPGFPNLFSVLGPNSPTASISLTYSAELSANYIAQWLHRFRAGELLTVEVTEEATTRFNDDVADAMGPTVWNTGCNSWYFTEQGNVDLWPFDRRTMASMLKAPDPRDFIVTRRQPTEPTARG